jgi:hypothetical protein
MRMTEKRSGMLQEHYDALKIRKIFLFNRGDNNDELSAGKLCCLQLFLKEVSPFKD